MRPGMRGRVPLSCHQSVRGLAGPEEAGRPVRGDVAASPLRKGFRPVYGLSQT